MYHSLQDTTDYVAYVAKDPVNRRGEHSLIKRSADLQRHAYENVLLWLLSACHILECSDGLAQNVISTIGQAFDLRFQQYLQCPSSKLSSTHDRWDTNSASQSTCSLTQENIEGDNFIKYSTAMQYSVKFHDWSVHSGY